MFKKIFLILSVLLFCPLCFAGQPANTVITPVMIQQQNNSAPSDFPPDMVKFFGKEYLHFYFSLPPEQRTDALVNQWGTYEVHEGPDANSQYKPDTILDPLRPEWQRKEAEFYFNEGLKMKERERLEREAKLH